MIIQTLIAVAAAAFMFAFVFLFMKLSRPVRTDRDRRIKLKFDNLFTAQTGSEMWRSLVTPADRYEASAQTRADLAKHGWENRYRKSVD